MKDDRTMRIWILGHEIVRRPHVLGFNSFFSNDDGSWGVAWVSVYDITVGGMPGLKIQDRTNSTTEDGEVTLLIPDRTKENREDFIWCVPIERVKWNRWFKLSEKFKTVTPMGVRYMNRMEGRAVRSVLVMPTEQHTDDDAVTACAWLRMVKQLTCRMYVVRCTDDPLTGSRRINAVVGADPALLEEVEDSEDDAADPASGD